MTEIARYSACMIRTLAELLAASNWLRVKGTLHLVQCDMSCLQVSTSSRVESELETTFCSGVFFGFDEF
jgi:hypothetical protein